MSLKMLLNTFSRCSVVTRHNLLVHKNRYMGSIMQHSTSFFKLNFQPLKNTKEEQKTKQNFPSSSNDAMQCPSGNANPLPMRAAPKKVNSSDPHISEQKNFDSKTKNTSMKQNISKIPNNTKTVINDKRAYDHDEDDADVDPNAPPIKIKAPLKKQIIDKKCKLNKNEDQRKQWMSRVAPETKRRQQVAVSSQTSNKNSENNTQKPNKIYSSNNGQQKSWMTHMRDENQRKQNDLLSKMQKTQALAPKIGTQKKESSVGIIGVQARKSMNLSPNNNITETKLQGSEDKVQNQADQHPIDIEMNEYLKAIKKLNSLNLHEERGQPSKNKGIDSNIEDMISYLEKSGLTLTDLEKIPMIQITGTKGRGCTGAIVESILRAHGVCTGFYSAPHIFLTTERIRINGKPLPKKQFIELFWELYNKLHGEEITKITTEKPMPMPSYHKFLTIMAFHVFVRERVNVAILEVGAAGASDCTNIIKHVRTIGITTLGMEQSSSLSNSMRDIAWNKAAIMKENANVFTSALQPECLEVLAQRAKNLKANFHKVPQLQDYIDDDLANKKILNDAHYMVRLNGSLGIQLAYDWMRNYTPESVEMFEPNTTQLTKSVARGLVDLNWPGHFEVVKHDIFNVYLDCADSLESMLACRDWFYKLTRSSRTPKVLLFNKVNEVNSKDMLYILRSKLRFEEACFVPNPTLIEGERIEDVESKSMIWNGMEELQRAKQNASNWRILCEESGRKDNSQLAISIGSFFEYLKTKYGMRKFGMRQQLDVLVTGSYQLVGATIKALTVLKAGKKSDI